MVLGTHGQQLKRDLIGAEYGVMRREAGKIFAIHSDPAYPHYEVMVRFDDGSCENFRCEPEVIQAILREMPPIEFEITKKRKHVHITGGRII